MSLTTNPFVFAKYHGLGNDFMILNHLHHTIAADSFDIPLLANRHLGVGFDQLLVIHPATNADAYCQIYNADGSQAEQCGNGLRCVARYLYDEGIVKKKSFSIETLAGIFPVEIKNNGDIQLTLAPPCIQQTLFELPLPSKRTSLTILETGNPHAIVKVDNVETIAMTDWGNEIATHPFFPHGTNVGFMQILNRQHAKLRTLERGVGETHACGSNACAAAVAGILNHWLDHRLQIEFRFGSLMIQWEGEGSPIIMTGPAVKVFDGKLAGIAKKESTIE